MEIRNGCYRLTYVEAITPGDVCIRVADPKMEIGIQVGGEDLAGLILFLCQQVEKAEPEHGSGKEKTYNHAFDLAFAVPDSNFEDPNECLDNEMEKVTRSFLARVGNLFEERQWLNPATNETQTFMECNEAFGGYDTYENEGESK